MLESGMLVRSHRGVYRIASSPESWEAILRSAVVGIGGLVSHKAAARLWKIDGFRNAAPEISIQESKRASRGGITVHLSRQMHLAAPQVIDGLPVTGPARTVLDLFAVLWPERRLQVLDAVLRDKILELEDLYDVLVCHSVQGRNGVGILRRTLDEQYDPATIPDSRWNRMVGQLLARNGIQNIVYEHEVRSSSGEFLGRLDLAIADLRIGIELDSIRWHLNRDSFVRDPRRRNRLQLEGWTILNFTWADYVDRPDELVATVRETVRKAKRLRSSEAAAR